jgi:hypothetical protein
MATWFSIPRGTMMSWAMGQSISLVEHFSVTCDISLSFDIAMKVRFHELEPLLDTALNVSASLTNVSNHYENERCQ